MVTAGPGEHDVVGLFGEVDGEQGGQEAGQPDVAHGVVGLGWAEEQLAFDLVQGADVGVDVDAAGGEVDVVAGEAGEFSPPHAGVGGGEDEQPVAAAGLAGDDRDDLLGGGMRSLSADAFRDADSSAGVEGQTSVFDGFLKDHRQDHDHVGDRSW
ncbi:hypothetical protein [Micromonospora sp. NPDC047187]|uniref:hypothetical protein n=1 Tax=Micromonospora sp. NPDC047187 TaxID=3155262 RepID=UPI0033F62EC8